MSTYEELYRKKTRPAIILGQDTQAKMAVDQFGSVRVPLGGTGSGAGFGEQITDQDREFAVSREPVAYRVTYMVADDCFDNWFEVDDPRTEGADADLDRKIQEALKQLNAKSVFSNALALERIHGYSIIVGGFDDAETQEALAKPLKEGSELKELAVYPKTKITSIEKEKDEDNERFGEPVIYNINRGGRRRLRVHYTRVIHVQTRPKAESILDPIWDDLTNLRNIRWGMGQTMFRYGSGFPTIKIPSAGQEQLKEWAESGLFDNLMSRSWVMLGEGMEFDFKGTAGRALNPEPYYKAIMESLSVGTGIPEAVLRGAQAGALTGSEVNEREYFKVISSIQSKFEPYVRWVIDKVLASKQVEATVKDYVVDWLGGFEINEKDKAAAELLREQSQQIRLNYMTVDEVREFVDKEALPNGEGKVVLGVKKSQPQMPPTV